MKKIFCLLSVIIFGYVSHAQTVGVEKSIFNIQAGFLGTWINYESRLTDEIALRAEIGFDVGLRGGSLVGKTIVGLAPAISVEPRWYYNISKREKSGKFVKKNSANFLTLGIKYNPDWFVISNTDNAEIADQLSIIPKWGIRRAIAKSNFNYEVGLGIGKRYFISAEQWETAADLHLRLGYSF